MEKKNSRCKESADAGKLLWQDLDILHLSICSFIDLFTEQKFTCAQICFAYPEM